VRLAACTWPELDRDGALRLLIPLGATEQHGPHLPLETDTIIAVALAEAAAARCVGTLVAPALPYGSSGEHGGFPGTLSIGQAALESVVVELVRSADRFEQVVLVAWHGGNAGPVARSISQLRSEGRQVRAWEPSMPGGDAHAGRVETSLMLAIAPTLVLNARPVGATEPIGELLPALRTEGVRTVSPNGVLGDARGSTVEEGRALLASLAADLASFLDGAAVVL
jgi:mycofactocin system creatininase family protein